MFFQFMKFDYLCLKGLLLFAFAWVVINYFYHYLIPYELYECKAHRSRIFRPASE